MTIKCPVCVWCSSHQFTTGGVRLCLNCKSHVPPETIRGVAIVNDHYTPANPKSHIVAGRVVLLDRGLIGDDVDQFVTGWQRFDDGGWRQSWSHGHYFREREEAVKDFESRKARGF